MYLSLVRELQQDVRELNQADLPEVDPEENSAEFMGILIKVHTSQHTLLIGILTPQLCYIHPVFYAVISVRAGDTDKYLNNDIATIF